MFIWIKRELSELPRPRGLAAAENAPLPLPVLPSLEKPKNQAAVVQKTRKGNLNYLDPREIGALLIAIDEYPVKKWRLYKAKTDAVKFRRVLKQIYNIPAGNIRVLYDQEATKRRICGGFQWLIDNFEYGAVYMSGHGCRVRAKDKPGNVFVEAFIVYDHAWSRAGMLLDEDIKRYLSQLKRCWLVVDACHSAGLSRSVENQGIVRAVAAPPEGVKLGKLVTIQSKDIIEFAACLSHEQAFELPDGGAFTSALCRFLTEYPDMDNETLQEKIRESVRTNQTPAINDPSGPGGVIFTERG